MTQKERIEQLEEEVRKLKILVQLAIGLGGTATYVLHHDNERWCALCQYMAHMGLNENTEFKITQTGVTVIQDGKEISEWSLKEDSHET
ncbi:MAG: hypothetical protein J5614_08530 [Paludibacteraceae bacterium]|nr:hypothetical protein [Paludibacteraceae bacterium]